MAEALGSRREAELQAANEQLRSQAGQLAVSMQPGLLPAALLGASLTTGVLMPGCCAFCPFFKFAVSSGTLLCRPCKLS